MNKLFIIFSIFLLIYMLWPGPSRIDQFPPLPNSVKSTLEGDTIQIPNVAAYFSDNFRNFVVSFYRNEYWKKTFLPFPPMTLNYAPEFSWIAIKKHTDSTYLEELVYPLRSSLYVNGFEPFYSDGQPKYWGATKFEIGTNAWDTKVTLRFYSSNVLIRILVWCGICLSILWIYKLGRKIIV